MNPCVFPKGAVRLLIPTAAFSKNTRVPCSQTQGLFSTPALRLLCVDVQSKITDIMGLRLLANSVKNRALAPAVLQLQVEQLLN
jgi:hypothetical protein